MRLLKLLSFFLLFVACEPVVTVRVDPRFNTVVETGFIKAASIVANFDHQYDTCKLTVTRQVDVPGSQSSQYFYEKFGEPVFNNISLSQGTYGFYIASIDADTISSFMEFIAYNNSVSIVNGPNTVLLDNTESSQALILVDKTSVDGAPSIQVGSSTGIMSVSTDHYYAYVKSNAILQYSIGGNQQQLPVNITKQKIYLLSASQGDISITDPYVDIIII